MLISTRGVNGASRQAATLQLEGVIVERNAMGEYSINLTEYGWFPETLPSQVEPET